MKQLFGIFLLGLVQAISAAGPPVIPVGLDAYRMWDHWPYQRIGERAYMRSTYDRSGGNERADAAHYLYQTADDSWQSLTPKAGGTPGEQKAEQERTARAKKAMCLRM